MCPQSAPPCDAVAPVSAIAGIGVKPIHYHDLLNIRPRLAFVEVHPENYMGLGGPPHAYLSAIAERYPLSFHGVGMSLGGIGPLDPDHLLHWRRLTDRYQPALVSEHLAWSNLDGVYFHDLLPIPYTAETLRTVCEHIDQMQTALGRPILLENPATYLGYADSSIEEAEFIVETARRSGCGLLLDINNVYVSTKNRSENAQAWLSRIPGNLVGEIHLAGHSAQEDGDLAILIDDHASPVCEDVWELYRETVMRIGPKPTLIEWDNEVPNVMTLCREAHHAEELTNLDVETQDAA